MTALAADQAEDVAASEYAAFQQARGGFMLRSPSGLYRHDGPDALDLLHRITTNDLASLTPGKAKRTVIADERGRVVDAPWVVMRESDDLLLLTDLQDTHMFERAILKYTIIEDACLTGMDGQLRRISLIGDWAERVLRRIVGKDCDMENQVGDWIQAGESIVLRTSFGDMPAWEIVMPVSQLDAWMDDLGAELPQLSDDTFHAIRISESIPWPGYELTHTVNPLECGLMDLIDFDKGCYVGQEVIARLDTYDKVQRALVQLRIADGRSREASPLPIATDELRDAAGERKVGWISSSAVLPDTREWVGLGFVRVAHSEAGTELAADSNGSRLVVAG